MNTLLPQESYITTFQTIFPVFNFYSMEISKREKYTTVYRQKASSENINKLNIKKQNFNWDEVYTDNDPETINENAL